MTTWWNQRMKRDWVQKFILDGKSEVEGAHILRKISGPHEDGSEVKVVTDGTLYINARFTKKAIEEEFTLTPSQEYYFGDSQGEEWDRCAIVLKEYSLHHVLHENPFGCYFMLTVDKFSFHCNEMGLYFNEEPRDCMKIQPVQAKSKHLWEKWREEERPRDDSDIPLSFLIEQFSESLHDATDYSTPALVDKAGSSKEISDRPILSADFKSVQSFLISKDDQQKLDAIEEWQIGFRPTVVLRGESPGISPSKQSSENVYNGKAQSQQTDVPRRGTDAACPVNMSVQVGDSLLDAESQAELAEPPRPAKKTTKESGDQVGQSLLANGDTQPSQQPVEKTDTGSSPLECIPEDNETVDEDKAETSHGNTESLQILHVTQAPPPSKQGANIRSTQRDECSQIPAPDFPVSPLSQFKSQARHENQDDNTEAPANIFRQGHTETNKTPEKDNDARECEEDDAGSEYSIGPLILATDTPCKDKEFLDDEEAFHTARSCIGRELIPETFKILSPKTQPPTTRLYIEETTSNVTQKDNVPSAQPSERHENQNPSNCDNERGERSDVSNSCEKENGLNLVEDEPIVISSGEVEKSVDAQNTETAQPSHTAGSKTDIESNKKDSHSNEIIPPSIVPKSDHLSPACVSSNKSIESKQNSSDSIQVFPPTDSEKNECEVQVISSESGKEQSENSEENKEQDKQQVSLAGDKEQTKSNSSDSTVLVSSGETNLSKTSSEQNALSGLAQEQFSSEHTNKSNVSVNSETSKEAVLSGEPSGSGVQLSTEETPVKDPVNNSHQNTPKRANVTSDDSLFTSPEANRSTENQKRHDDVRERSHDIEKDSHGLTESRDPEKSQNQPENAAPTSGKDLDSAEAVNSETLENMSPVKPNIDCTPVRPRLSIMSASTPKSALRPCILESPHGASEHDVPKQTEPNPEVVGDISAVSDVIVTPNKENIDYPNMEQPLPVSPNKENNAKVDELDYQDTASIKSGLTDKSHDTASIKSDRSKEAHKSKVPESHDPDLIMLKMSELYGKIDMEEQQRQLTKPRGLLRSANDSGNSSVANVNTSDGSIKETDQTQNLSVRVDEQEIKDMFLAHTSPNMRTAPSKDKSILLQNLQKTPKSIMHKSVSSPAALVSASEEADKHFFNDTITPVRRLTKKRRKMGESDSDSDWSCTDETGAGKKGAQISTQKFRTLGVRKTFQPNKSVQENIQNMLVTDGKPRYDSSVLFQNKPALKTRGRGGRALQSSLSKSRKALYSDKGGVLLEVPQVSQGFDTAHLPSVLEESSKQTSILDISVKPIRGKAGRGRGRGRGNKMAVVEKPEEEVIIEEVESPVYEGVKRKFKSKMVDDDGSIHPDISSRKSSRLVGKEVKNYHERLSLDTSYAPSDSDDDFEDISLNKSATVKTYEGPKSKRAFGENPQKPKKPLLSPSEEKFNQIIDQQTKQKVLEGAIVDTLKECMVQISPLKVPPSKPESSKSRDSSMESTNEKRKVVLKTSVVKVTSRDPSPNNIKALVPKKKPLVTQIDEFSEEAVICIDDSGNEHGTPDEMDKSGNDNRLAALGNLSNTERTDCLVDLGNVSGTEKSDRLVNIGNISNAESCSHSGEGTKSSTHLEVKTPTMVLKKSFYGSSEKDKSLNQSSATRRRHSLSLRNSSVTTDSEKTDSEAEALSIPSRRRKSSDKETFSKYNHSGDHTPISLHSSSSENESPQIPNVTSSSNKQIYKETEQRKRSLDRTSSVESSSPFITRKRLSVETPINSLPSYQPIKSQLIRRELNDTRERQHDKGDVLQNDDIQILSSGTSSSNMGGSGRSMSKTQLDVLEKIEDLLGSRDRSNRLLNIAFSDTSYSGMYGQYL